MHAYTAHPAQKGQKPPIHASLNALRELTAERRKEGEKGEKKEKKRDGKQID